MGRCAMLARMTGEVPERPSEIRRAFNRARDSRAPILELAVRAEYVLGEALAGSFAADETAAAILIEHVLWRVPVETKLKLLSDAMKAHDISDTFPFVVPVLGELFRVRNILAHSLEAPVPEGARVIGYRSVHRGRISEHSLSIVSLNWLRQQGEQVFGELVLISGAFGDLHGTDNPP